MPAQLGPPSPSPQPLLLAGPSTLGRRSGALFWFVSPHPIFFISPVLFVSLALGWGLLKLAGFQTYRQIAS